MKTTDASSLIKANLKQAKVLIVEDNDDQWVLIKRAMTHCLVEVELQRISSADEAFSLLDDWRLQEWELPKLILLDLYMPLNQNGFAFIKQLKAMGSPLDRIPIVVLSSSEVSDDICEAYTLGAASYMVKPISLDGWLACFQELRQYWWETVTLPPLRYGVF